MGKRKPTDWKQQGPHKTEKHDYQSCLPWYVITYNKYKNDTMIYNRHQNDTVIYKRYQNDTTRDNTLMQ